MGRVDYEGSNMRHIVDKIEIEESAIYLIDPGKTSRIKVVESFGGEDLTISDGDGNYIVVDSRLFIGSIKALMARGHRARVNSKGRNK